MEKRNRVVFYSIEDLSGGWNLENAEILLKNINLESDFSINDFLEFYNIKKYFDNGVHLKKWSEEEKKIYINLSGELGKKTILFFQSINDKNIIDLVKELNHDYEKDFWELINKFKIYENINDYTINNILTIKGYLIRSILIYKNIVLKFKDTIRLFLLNYDKSGEILLDYNKENGKGFIDGLLSYDDKENIIIKYINGNSDIFHNLKLIENMGDGFLKISPKTKLEAKKMYEKKNEEFFLNNNTLSFGFNISLSETQKESIKIDNNNQKLPNITYSISFFSKLDFENKPFILFTSLFNYINKLGLIDLISKESEIGIMEGFFMHWNEKDYKRSNTFVNKEMLSLLNMQILQVYLNKFKNLSLEVIINNYIENILVNKFNIEYLNFKLNSSDRSYQEKITNIIPKFDSFIKQYNCFISEGKIDFDLINIDSKPISYNSIPSILDNKYFYELANKLSNLKYNFYSDQSGLFYIDGYENKYNNFYNLITKEKLKISNFHDYQVKTINYLIEEGYLYIDENEYIKIKDEIFIFIVGEINREGVLSYYSYNDKIRKKINEMKVNDLLLSESTLLSRQEIDYFNYYLNKSKFLNGPDIRNKNIHGYQYTSENEAYTDYLNLLKIIILLLLKIDFELSNIN